MSWSAIAYRSIAAFLEGNLVYVLIGVFVLVGVVAWRVGSWKKGVDDDRSNFKKFMDEIRDKINEIFLRLPPPITVSTSPIQLSEFGQKIADDVNVSGWVYDLAGDLQDDLPYPKGDPYGIQEWCFQYTQKNLYENLDPSIQTMLRDSAFKHGIELQKVLEVIGVVLRDIFFDRLGIELPD